MRFLITALMFVAICSFLMAIDPLREKVNYFFRAPYLWSKNERRLGYALFSLDLTIIALFSYYVAGAIL